MPQTAKSGRGPVRVAARADRIVVAHADGTTTQVPVGGGAETVAAVRAAVDQDRLTALLDGEVADGSTVLLLDGRAGPRTAPMPAGTVATVFCWVVECAQLTGVPAELSAQSLAARLALGVQFDPIDLAWYPAGVAPLVVLHHLRARTRPASRPPHDIVPPPAALPVDTRP